MDLTQSKKALESLRGTLNDETIDFFTGLWSVQEDITPVAWEPIDPDRPWGEKPLFEHEAPEITQAQLFEALTPVASFIGENIADFSPLVESLAGESTPELPEEVLKDVFVNQTPLVESLASYLEIDPESDVFTILRLVVVSALQPTAVEAAQAFTHPKETLRTSDCCPTCGAPSSFGSMKDAGELSGGSRELWCSFCETTWTYPRIRCTRCGNEKQEELGYYFDENDQGRRVYYCKECSGVHKMIDEKTLETRWDPRVEEILLSGLEEESIRMLEEADKALEEEG